MAGLDPAIHVVDWERWEMDDPVNAAARVIYAAGLHHDWFGFTKSYDQLDPIGRSEFEGIIQEALAAADNASSEQNESKR